MKKFQPFLAFAIAVLLPLAGWGQTNPTPFDLSTGNWTLTGWSNTAGAGNYPGNGATGSGTTGVVTGAANANMVFWRHDANDPGLTMSNPNSDYTGNYSGTSGSRVNGNSAKGFSFVNTGTGGNLGSACLAINTTGRTNISIAWTGRTITSAARDYAIRLQYRIGNSGQFVDADGAINYLNGNTNSSTSLTSTLPAAADNQPVVQVLWRYYFVTGSGQRPDVGVDDITVSSSPAAPACTGPTTAATAFTASAVTTTGATLDWTSGDGTARVAFLKDGAFTAATPVVNTTYTANNSFTGNGMGFDGGKTVYNNSGNSVSVTDLTPNTRYYAKVFEYLGAAGAECYHTTALSGNFTTLSNPATAAAASPISANSFTANWTAPTGNGSATLTYTLEVATDNAFSNLVQTNSGISSVNTSFSVTSLTPATTYYYRVTAVNSGGASALSNAIVVTTASAMPPAFTSTQNCGSVTLNAYTGPDASTYYWQTDPMNPNTNFPATQPYVVTASGQYSVQAYANGLWSSANSANIIVPNNPTITTQPSNTSVGAGSTATFTVVANNAGSYQWQVNDGYGFVNLSNNAQYSGVDTATLTVSNTTLFMDYYQYRVVVKAAAPCTVDVNSTSATLNVTPVSNATDYFRSRTTGLYGNASTWESSADSITWINATSAPTDAAKSVTIRVNDSVTVATSGRTAARLYVFGKLTLSGQNLAIADSSGYDVVIFSGGRFDCGTNTSGNGFNLPTNASVLVKTGGRIIARINVSLNEPVRISTKYFYEDAAVVEYTGSGAITTGSNATYSLPTTSVGAIPILLFNNTIGNSGANTTTTFNCFVELGTGYTIPWTGDGQKVFNGGLLINGEMRFNNNTPFVISGTNTTLSGSGTITLGTGTGANTGGMSIASGANVQLLSDVTINGVSTLTASLNGTLNTNGHKISGTAKFATAAGSTLVVTDAAGITGSGTSGNIQTTGTRTFNTSGNYIYRSTAAQSTGDGLTGSATLEIDNPAGVTLSAPHTATTGLTLTSGNLATTATNLLTLGAAATITGGSATAFIDGPLKRATAAATGFVFPVGKGTAYAPVTLTPEDATPSDYTAEYFNATTPNRTHKDAALKFVAANEYFDISRGTGANAKITLTYTTAAQVTDPGSLVVAHYNGTEWVSEGGTATGNNTSGTVISGNYVSSFSPFALGSTSAAQPLPVQLLSFQARKEGETATLTWELATTDGGETVVVERSTDGKEFISLHLVKATPARQARGSFTDPTPMPGDNLYRLRLTDPQGATQFSKVQLLRFSAPGGGWRLYPNPAGTTLHVEGPDAARPVQVRVYSATGQLVFSGNGASVSVAALAAGRYWVVATQDGQVVRRQVEVAR